MSQHVRIGIVAALAFAFATSAAAQEFKVKLEGTAQDRAKFLERLNENGKEQGVSFVDTESGYQYRIAIYSEGAKGSDFVFGGGADASAAVLTPDTVLLGFGLEQLETPASRANTMRDMLQHLSE